MLLCSSISVAQCVLIPSIAAQVLGVSVDSPFSHLAWVQTGELKVIPRASSPYLCSRGPKHVGGIVPPCVLNVAASALYFRVLAEDYGQA